MFVVVEGAFGKGKGKEWFDGLIKYKPIGLAVKPLKEGKHEFWSLQTAGNDEVMFVAQADATTVIGCQSKDVLLKALSRSGRDKLAVKEKLIEVANRIDPKANLWMAAAPKEMDEYVTAHASIIVTDGIKVVATVANKDADAARNMVSDLKEEMKDLADLLDDAAKQLPLRAAVRDVLPEDRAESGEECRDVRGRADRREHRPANQETWRSSLTASAATAVSRTSASGSLSIVRT